MLTENSRHVKNYQSNEHKNLSGNRFELRDHDGVLNRYVISNSSFLLFQNNDIPQYLMHR
jgi:hypothetical protein